MTTAWVPLAEITLTSTDSEVVFGSIPNTYRDLVLVFDYVTSVNTNANLRFNSDSGTNYPAVAMAGPVSSFANTYNRILVNINGTNATRNSNIIQIFDYAQTDKHTTTLNRVSGDNASNVWAVAGRWANTAAVHTCTLTVDAGTFSIGSTFALYGSNKL